ncbi:hypothetical protein [Actinokineospora sp. NPDC004072]
MNMLTSGGRSASHRVNGHAEVGGDLLAAPKRTTWIKVTPFIAESC